MWFGKKKQTAINNQLAQGNIDLSRPMTPQQIFEQLNALNQLNNQQPVQHRLHLIRF